MIPRREGARVAATAAWALLVLLVGTVRARDTADAIHRTIAAGDEVWAAAQRYRAREGRDPVTVEELVEHGLSLIPTAAYGTGQWVIEGEPRRASPRLADRALGVELSLAQGGYAATTGRTKNEGTALVLAVQVLDAPRGYELRRGSDGCWRLPALGRCLK